MLERLGGKRYGFLVAAGLLLAGSLALAQNGAWNGPPLNGFSCPIRRAGRRARRSPLAGQSAMPTRFPAAAGPAGRSC